jgi:hypothetical protein
MSSVDVAADDVEITYLGLGMTGLPSGLSDGSAAIESGFKLDSSSLSLAKDPDAKIEVKQVRIVPAEGVHDLTFLETVVVTMVAAHNPQIALAIATYQRPSDGALYPQLAITNPQPVDVAGVWADKPVKVTLALRGQLPSAPWSVNVTIVLDGQFTVGL